MKLTLETHSKISSQSVAVGRENYILSCSSTTCCSAAELAENLFSGGGISCYVDVLFKHSFITSQMFGRKQCFFFFFSPLKNVGRMHQSEPSDLKCSRNSISVHCKLAGFTTTSQEKTLHSKQPEQVGLHLKYREMGSGNNTDCTAFCTHDAQIGEKCIMV